MCWLELKNPDLISTVWDIPTPPGRVLSVMLEDRMRYIDRVIYPIENRIMMSIFGNILETVSLDNAGGLALDTTDYYGFEMEVLKKPAPLRHTMFRNSSLGQSYMPLAPSDRILWIQVRRYGNASFPNVGILVCAILPVIL